MNYVAIDTASGTLKVLVKYGGGYRYYSDETFKSASEKLMVEIDFLLKKLGASLKEMDFFACVTGPGSFTGIRIGLATVKAFAYVFKKPVLPVNSLELLASYELSDTVVSVMDASNGMRYVAVYNDKGGEIMPPRVIEKNELAGFLSLVDEPHVIIADAVTGREIENAIVPVDLQSAFIRVVESNVKRLTDGNLVEPLYIRKPQAVVDLEKRESNV